MAGLIAVWFLEARGLVAAGLATAPVPPWAAEWSVRLGLFAAGAMAAIARTGLAADYFHRLNPPSTTRLWPVT